jgi:uncharacterized hydrophobic protein (TIGR00341 family)
MALRLIQITAPREIEPEELVESSRLLAVWNDCRDDDTRVIHLAVPAEKTEAIMDDLENRLGHREGFRLALLEIEALLPRPEEEDAETGEIGTGAAAGIEEGAGAEAESEPEKETEKSRISREELYADLTDGLDLSPTFLAMTVLSAVVATVGLLRNDLAVIIGAMVLAPLLRPNVALALATTLADRKLAWRAFKTNAIGVATAVALAAAVGRTLPVDPTIPSLASRTGLDLGSLALALAAGAAGTLAFTQGLSGAVIGVMVAVALLPPAVAFGLLTGAGFHKPAFHAFLLTAGNVICINLAGVATFLVEGIRPRNWWEAERARRASLIAVAVWLLLLAALVAVLWSSGELTIFTEVREVIP